LSAAAVVSALVLLLSGGKPDTYTERSLCDLWAGAQCHATSCKNDGKERCASVSRRCATATQQTVPKERAEKAAACARALLTTSCGGESPAECADVTL
jgi:hypothetical protein